ncbi:hypothetical protein [Fructilactobacillus florum]|uniref:hypothetical protein n=1 Tax=Fructilactobacillus florum TaxID=640331 RepID=UPI002092FBB4|nr:hypothetical protein [Fructilactobacillus florum]
MLIRKKVQLLATKETTNSEQIKSLEKKLDYHDSSTATLTELEHAKVEAALQESQKLHESLAHRKDLAKEKQQLYENVVHTREYEVQSGRSNSDNIHAFIEDARKKSR